MTGFKDSQLPEHIKSVVCCTVLYFVKHHNQIYMFSLFYELRLDFDIVAGSLFGLCFPECKYNSRATLCVNSDHGDHTTLH